MPTPITEFFNGGVVTARHPALLMPGEVQQADHCVYRLHDTSIQRAPGRTIYNSTPLSAGLKGLAQLTFDQRTDQLIAWPQGDGTNSFLYKSDFTAITGVFSIITGPGVVIVNTHSNTTIDGAPAGSFTNMIVGTRITGSGIPNGTGWSSVLGNGYYWFLVTEILTSDNPDVPDIEAGYTANEGRAVVVQITTYATQFIRITFPTIKNDGTNGTNRATHWGIYMSFITAGVAAFFDPMNILYLGAFLRIAKMTIEDY